MKSFLLDSKPNFGEAKTVVNDTEYRLVRVKGNGCYLSVLKGGVETDNVTFSAQDLKALFLLLSTEQ